MRARDSIARADSFLILELHAFQKHGERAEIEKFYRDPYRHLRIGIPAPEVDGEFLFRSARLSVEVF